MQYFFIIYISYYNNSLEHFYFIFESVTCVSEKKYVLLMKNENQSAQR